MIFYLDMLGTLVYFTVSSLCLKVKVIGQSSRSQEETSSTIGEIADCSLASFLNKSYRKADLYFKL